MHSNSAIGNEAPKSHDFLPVSDNNRSLWRATSSGNNPGGSDTTEDNAIDGKTGDHSEVFTTQKRANNWLQIDFGKELMVGTHCVVELKSIFFIRKYSRKMKMVPLRTWLFSFAL